MELQADEAGRQLALMACNLASLVQSWKRMDHEGMRKARKQDRARWCRGRRTGDGLNVTLAQGYTALSGKTMGIQVPIRRAT